MNINTLRSCGIIMNKKSIQYTIVWFFIFLANVNPAYLDRFTIFGLFTTAVKLAVFAYFVIFRVFKEKLSLKILPWIGYGIIPTIVTISRSGDTRSALIYTFTILSAILVFFYINTKHVRFMIGGLAALMELLVFINLLTIIVVPNGLYLYETEAGWSSRDVWFFGLRNSHSPFLCLACFASVLNYFLNGGRLKKIRAVLTHIIAIGTVVLLSSGGGMVSFAVYFVLLIILARKNITNIKPIILKIRLVVLINIGVFLFLSFFIANTNYAYFFSLLGDMRIYTMGRRISIWAAVWEHIHNYPIFGHGFMKASELKWLSTLAAGAVSSHNSMMDICFRGGYVTFVIYCIMLITAGKSIDDNEQIHYRIRNYFAASWFTILLLLQSEGAMMSVPLLTIVGITMNVGKAVKQNRIQFISL